MVGFILPEFRQKPSPSIAKTKRNAEGAEFYAEDAEEIFILGALCVSSASSAFSKGSLVSSAPG
jgi:hypothetical protein